MNQNYINALFEQMVEHCLTEPFLAPLAHESCPWTVSMLAEGIKKTVTYKDMEWEDGYNPMLMEAHANIVGGPDNVSYCSTVKDTGAENYYRFSSVCEVLRDKIFDS